MDPKTSDSGSMRCSIVGRSVMFLGLMSLTSPIFIASISRSAKYSIGERMMVRTYLSKGLIRMAVIALCLTSAYSPVVASQETKKEAVLSCDSSDVTFPRPSAEARKEIPETKGQQEATGTPEAQDKRSLSS